MIGCSQTILDWRKDLPEVSGLKVLETYTCDFIPVLVTGRFRTNEGPFVDLVNRMRRKETGNEELDKSNALHVPLDGKWHWQTAMSEILAWSPLPNEDDPRWISSATALPEESQKIHHAGSLKVVSVLGLCEMFKDYTEVKLINRLIVERTGSQYLDSQATDGWVWSNNSGNVKAWMPFPEPYKEGEKEK